MKPPAAAVGDPEPLDFMDGYGVMLFGDKVNVKDFLPKCPFQPDEIKRQLLEMARNGEPRPTYGTPLYRAFMSFTGGKDGDSSV